MIVEDHTQLGSVKNAYMKELYGDDSLSIKVTRKAEAKAMEYGIDLSDLAGFGAGIIRESDIEDFVATRKEPDLQTDEQLIGKLNEDFVHSILSDYDAFSCLASEEKIARYRDNGAKIGSGVKIGKGSVIITDYLHMMDDSSIGSQCYIRARDFSLGRMSVVGNKANFVVHKITIGDVCTFGFNVIVSGGFTPSAVLKIGERSLVSANCLLDAGEGITIGREVGISPYVKLYTHNHWQSELEGYHSNFGPIVIEDKAYVTGDSLIVPGVTIGTGATILANSTVIDNVAPRTQVCGNPARVIGRAAGELSMDVRERIVHRLLKEMRKIFFEQRIMDPNDVVYLPQYVGDSSNKGKIVITFDVSEEVNKDSLECTLVDLKKLYIYGRQNERSDEVRNFLRRRGIRLKPILWRYTGDRHLYND